jgi:hypothetical protein
MPGSSLRFFDSCQADSCPLFLNSICEVTREMIRMVIFKKLCLPTRFLKLKEQAQRERGMFPLSLPTSRREREERKRDHKADGQIRK